MPARPQAAILDFLSRPDTFGTGTGAARRVDTHISHVFLAGEHAWKLKRAVRLPFVDFRALAQRAAACRAELEINRRFSPGLYLGLVAITKGGGGRLALDGRGQTVDWLVKMARFPDEARFDRLVEADKITFELTRDLARTVAELHRAAIPRPDLGGAAGLAAVIESNHASFVTLPPDILAFDAIAQMERSQLAWLDRLAPLLDRRRRDGFVRRCHGDLHLANLCLFEGRPMPFDAIEFSDELAVIDVFYDLAFLLMDLDQRGRRDLASLILNRYLELTGDYAGIATLPLFLSLRAAVRAHVTATLPNAAEDKMLTGQARAYLAAALASLDPPPARLIACGGLSGTGKSRLARNIAPLVGATPGALVLRSDVLRKQIAGVAPEERLPADGYSQEMGERTYALLQQEAERALAAGHSVIADAVFARPEQRAALKGIASRLGVAFTGLWLEVPPELARARIAARIGNASDATPAVFEQQLGYDLGAIEWQRLDASGAREETLAQARALLAP